MAFTILLIASLGQLPASADVRPLPVRGVVVDGGALGNVAAGADVWAADALSAVEKLRFGLESTWWFQTGPSEGTLPVLVHGRADDAGRFALEVPAEAAARRPPPALAVWAALKDKDGRWRLAARRLPRILLGDDEPVRIDIGKTVNAELIINGPDGKPVDGARVAPVRAFGLPVPDPLARKLAATTDAHGRASISGLDRDALEAVRVESAAYGTQILQDFALQAPGPGAPDASASGPVTLALARVGRVEGRLTLPKSEHAPVRGVKVRATSHVGGREGTGRTGEAVVDCDGEGRFTVPAIAAGLLDLRLEFAREAGPAWCVEPTGSRVLRPGQALAVALRTRPTVQVRASYRERVTKRPIAGVKIVLNDRLGGDAYAVTDAQGEARGRIAREAFQPFGWPVRIPAPYFVSAGADIDGPQRMPPRESDELTVPLIELERGVDLAGTVRGGDGRPVAGARVEALWNTEVVGAQAAFARSDRAGRFVLRGIDPNADLNISAWDEFAASAVVAFRPDPAQPKREVALELNPKFAAPLGGKVVDDDGRPIAGARVLVHRRLHDKTDREILIDVVPARGEDRPFELLTDAAGRFRAQHRFPTRFTYDAIARAPGHIETRAIIAGPKRPPQSAAVLVLPRLRTINGAVVDREGRPVAGARVFQTGDGPMPTETLSDAAGAFQLSGLLEGPALVFAEKDGYRSAVAVCATTAGGAPALSIVLARADGPPIVRYKTLPPILSDAEELALARRLLEPPIEQFQKADARNKAQFFYQAAEIDPLGLLERLGDLPFGGEGLGQTVRLQMVRGLARDHLDEAAELAEAEKSADYRAYGYIAICDERRDLPADRARTFRERATTNARGMAQARQRPSIEARIADRWLDLGETERARALLDEAVRIGRETERGGQRVDYNKGSVAAVLARLDLPAALKAIDELKEAQRKSEKVDRSYIYDRFYGHIAYHLAASAPAETERILKQMALGPNADRNVAAACFQMAPKDPIRARRIIEERAATAAPEFRPAALALMARALIESDRPGALRLIDETFDQLEALADSGAPNFAVGPAVLAAGALPAIERLAPERLPDALVRVLRMRPPRDVAIGPRRRRAAQSSSAVAMAVARYDRGLALALIEPELRRLDIARAATGSFGVVPLTALALVDPNRAVALVEALPDPTAPGTDASADKVRARLEVAHVLALHGEERWRHVRHSHTQIWEHVDRSW